MRVYRSDGSFSDSPGDVEFGWRCADIVIDESLPDYESWKRNRHFLSPERRRDFSLEQLRREMPLLIREWDPQVRVEFARSCVDSQLAPEGLGPMDGAAVRLDDPSKQQLASLIAPCSAEARMLLAVVHFAKYERLETSCHCPVELGLNSGKLDFGPGGHRRAADELRAQVDNYRHSNGRTMLSLMVELILSDVGCTVDDVCSGGGEEPNGPPTRDSPKSIDSSKGRNSIKGGKASLRQLNSGSGPQLRWSGGGGVGRRVGESIASIREITQEMHSELEQIKDSFRNDEHRIERLLEEARNLRRNLHELTYLEKLLQLLNGKTDKIKSRHLPFNIFNSNSAEIEVNLIV